MSAARVIARRSEVLAEVHPRVQRGDLVCIPVEHQSLTLEQLSDPPLTGLTPPGMIDLGIDVGVEAILVRCRNVPGGLWLVFRKADLHDRLATLEAILPGHDQAKGSTILVWQGF